MLRGKCSYCGEKISWQYPLIELLCCLIAVLLAPNKFKAEQFLIFAFYFSVFCVFLAHFIIDLRHQILPDGLNLYLALLFFGHSLIFRSWQHWLLGGFIGFGMPLLITWLFYKLRGKIGLGGGDIKLFGALGIFLGPLHVIYNIFLSCMLGSVVGIFLILLKKMDAQKAIPFGPYIIIVAALQIFFPNVMSHFFKFVFPR